MITHIIKKDKYENATGNSAKPKKKPTVYVKKRQQS